MNYWEECIRIAFEEAGINATENQIEDVVGAVEGGHENYGMYMGHDVASKNLQGNEDNEIKRLKKELQEEKEKTVCGDCKGSGNITTYGGTFQSTSRCYKCKGNGKV